MRDYTLSDAVHMACSLDDYRSPYHSLLNKPLRTLEDYKFALEAVESAPAYFGDVGPDGAGEKRACHAAARRLRDLIARCEAPK